MAKEKFKEVRFSSESLAKIRLCNQIVQEYDAQGLRLTLRQLYYQLVTRNAIRNLEREYKNLSSLVSNARLAGLIDWNAIEDRIRVPRSASEFNNLTELVEAALQAYRLPRWANQDYYVELWVEKDALAGVLEPLSREFHVTLMVNRGYCVAPDVRILTADLKWIAAGDVRLGTEVLGVDEDPPGYRKHRKLRVTTVESVHAFRSPRTRVVTDVGDIIVSSNHPFLTTKITKAGDNWHGYRWAHASTLKPGERIARLCSPWAEENTWDGGWLAAIYDGEGCLPATRLNVQLDVFQKPGLVADRIRDGLKRHGWLHWEKEAAKSGVITFRTYGVDHVIMALGSLRPVRLLDAFQRDVRRRGWPSKSKSPATVLAVEPLTNGNVVGIQTGARTLVTDGLISHNSSQSAMYESAQRFLDSGKPGVLFYLGDHDPSGEDMVRDIAARLEMFGAEVRVEKLALTMAQVTQYNPPPNPAKMTDPRAQGYVDQFGDESWEVDALPPNVLTALIRTAFETVLDSEAMDAVKEREERDKTRLREAAGKLTKRRTS